MIVIVDYGMGNLFSVQSAFRYLGAEPVISSDPDRILKAGKLVLPGVGSFHQAMVHLKQRGLADAIQSAVQDGGVPILGICLGMQLLGSSSTEDGFTEGFGWIETPVERFDAEACRTLKIPHVGFDAVTAVRSSKLLEGLTSPTDFYFTHSYRMAFTGQSCAVGVCSHGEPFVAAFEQGRICGTQFHPEKSQTNGLFLLKNFIEKF